MSTNQTDKSKSMAQRVGEIFKDCLFRPDEIVDEKTPENALVVEGIVNKVAFHPGRTEAHKPEIKTIIEQMNPYFLGNGWSFLNLCMDKNDQQWGDHINCEQLLVLAIATGQGKIMFPRYLWPSFPGGMPYINFTI